MQSLALARLAKPEQFRETLELAQRLAIEGVPSLPLGMLADWQAILQGNDDVLRPVAASPFGSLLRQIDDHVLGRLFASEVVDRASTAIRRYAPADRQRGIAFAIRRLSERLGLPGVEAAPAMLKSLAAEPPEKMLQESLESLDEGPLPALVEIASTIVTAFRGAAELLTTADVLALESRTALADLAQYVAHRQVLEQVAILEASLPLRPPTPLPGRPEVITNIRDEDHYPVGGYTSIATRGSMESLLHSQLAYMEEQDSPDLFDVKFVRDELFYYSRDENQFLRRRRAFGFHFDASLTEARVNDDGVPVQRIVMAMAFALATVRKLSGWLSHEGLAFSLTFDPALEPERKLAEILLIEERRRGVATVASAVANTTVQCLRLGTEVNDAKLQLIVSGPSPEIVMEGGAIELDWPAALLHLLKLWI